MEIIKINKEEMQEVSIWNELVFNKSFFHQFSDRLGDLATINVCDIGSGFPARTILLLENYTLEKVVCVDSMSEKELVSAFINPPPL